MGPSRTEERALRIVRRVSVRRLQKLDFQFVSGGAGRLSL